jgi:hypothetical protein
VIVLDTNVLSAPMRVEPDPLVVACLATRNVRHFTDLGVRLIDPWGAEIASDPGPPTRSPQGKTRSILAPWIFGGPGLI